MIDMLVIGIGYGLLAFGAVFSFIAGITAIVAVASLVIALVEGKDENTDGSD